VSVIPTCGERGRQGIFTLPACNVDVIRQGQLDERTTGEDVPIEITIRLVRFSVDGHALLNIMNYHLVSDPGDRRAAQLT
jgi:hypothetical protein